MPAATQRLMHNLFQNLGLEGSGTSDGVSRKLQQFLYLGVVPVVLHRTKKLPFMSSFPN